MDILKKIYLLMLLTAMAMGLTSCYTEFDPLIDSTPVLCMNSTITPDEPVTLFLSRTWNWTEGDESKLDLDVRNAEVHLIVNGEFKETLKPTTVNIPTHMSNPYPEERDCYQSEYLAECGDIIRLEAYSEQYGEASAEVRVPYPVPLDRLEAVDVDCKVRSGDISEFPIAASPCAFLLNFNLLAYLTDPSESTDHYDLAVGYTPSCEYNEETYAFIYGSYPWIDFSNEPLFKGHASVLESAVAGMYGFSGYTIFSDRQINGRTYPLRLGCNDISFAYQNPSDRPEPKEFGIKVTLRHIDSVYYKHVISVWKGNDGISGILGGVGLANPVYPYSNVSTGAGVVTAYAEASMTIPLADAVTIAEQKNNK